MNEVAPEAAGPGAVPSKSAPPSGPVILFDGVCNLCNAAVQWVIARDRRATFHFASLQSRAARAAIEAAESVDRAKGGADAPAERPDSVVLLDGEGLHFRSDAAIRIARTLGFPWSLAALGLVLPRFLRDGIYDWVARHRYRWFGKQNACLLPTPELRARFLDAEEPPPVLDAASEASTPAPALSSAQAPIRRSGPAIAGAFVQRFFLAYFFLYALCFPLGTIPGTQGLYMSYRMGVQAFVTWVAKVFFGLTITIYPAGSGDTTYNYVEVATFAALALLVALAGSIWKRGAWVSPRVRDGLRTYIRYYLAATLLGYGWSKVIPLQMPMPGPDRLLEPLGDLSPMGILWAFLGASPAYEIFAGLGEVVGGILLFWRRTALLGGLVSAAVMANIVALNFCYDVPVKLFSSHLLAMALFVIAPHLARLTTALLLDLPAQPVILRPFPIRRLWLRRTALAVKLAFIAWITIIPAVESYQYRQTLAPKPHGDLHGFYRVESFSYNGVLDRANPDAVRWVRVGINRMGVAGVQHADGKASRFGLEVDEKKRTFTIHRRDDPTKTITLGYAEPEPGLLRLEGPFEGGKAIVLLRREKDAKSRLLTRGFRWINEYPYNR